MGVEHVAVAALVLAPWLAVGGAVTTALGIAGCWPLEQATSGGTTLGAALIAAELAWRLLDGPG
jgi:hypothetical protein